MNVLFLGGTGLISTAIARKLLQRGEQVTCFNRGRSENRLPAHPNLTVINGDRSDRAAFEALFADKHYDVVVDMICFSPDDAASSIRAFKGRCGHFIFCSTVCVYSGPPVTIPTPEGEPYHSIGGYGKNKAVCEQLFLSEPDFPVTVMRPSHSYGEGGTLIRPVGGWGSFGTFPDRLRKGLPVVVPGDGTGLWASCHVDDVAEGFISVMGKPATIGECFNITGEENLTWNDYHKVVAEVVGGTFNPVYIPTSVLSDLAKPDWTGGLREIFAWPSIFTTDKIKAIGGYPGQSVSWAAGAARTIAWMEANGKAQPAESDPYEDRLIAAWQAALHTLNLPDAQD
nr:NAD-dependent epimerase/dehydratase family protein [Armatimonas sp.]